MDGATAILHLCRAWLSPKHIPYGAKDKVASIWSPQYRNSLDASYETLMNDDNRKLQLLVATESTTKRVKISGTNAITESTEITETSWCFENLAQQMFHILEQVRDRTKSRNPSTIDLHLKNRTLVGFDFLDLLRENGPVQPLSRQLQHGADEWLNMCTKLGTINLLSSNFGELIRPKSRHFDYRPL